MVVPYNNRIAQLLIPKSHLFFRLFISDKRDDSDQDAWHGISGWFYIGVIHGTEQGEGFPHRFRRV